VKEKVLAARRVGLREVILPRQNEKNVREDFSDDLRREITIHLVTSIEEVLALALNPLPAAQGPKALAGGVAAETADASR
jgi:ATP-dependent Lon protease